MGAVEASFNFHPRHKKLTNKQTIKMPEMNEKELEAMEQRCEATKAARQQLEADNEKLDLELMDAKAQLAKIQEGKDDFEAKLNKSEADIESLRLAMKDGEKKASTAKRKISAKTWKI